MLRKLLPQSRAADVHPEHRGWNWPDPPLAPVYNVSLGVSEVATNYCTSGRDVFLRRVLRQPSRPNPAMVGGRQLHRYLEQFMVAAKRAMYVAGIDCVPALRDLATPHLEWLVDYPNEHVDEETARKARVLHEFEFYRLMARVQEVLSRQPRIGIDALVAEALPVVLEQKLDGRALGLSPHLSVDGFVFTEPMVVDVKFGPREEFHQLTTTGYALVKESLTESPVNLGCIVYVRFRGDRVEIERDFHIIDDELRHRFIELRDDKQRLIQTEHDPGLPPTCYALCAYQAYCTASGASPRPRQALPVAKAV